ncbi:hypothetical protein [Pyxidicoccus sp. MSG2]|uniref:hypothetical protein n=1 Tax=Pyxidicoccus sp. MSG2 TaxID=2996790 RepID=UPI00226F8C19|nr:hypothetical protein [Pyxidicoccus sp. MSG2]MCY1019869.1 hypothetical protein [Pyxidicoccus sp. MSG2]
MGRKTRGVGVFLGIAALFLLGWVWMYFNADRHDACVCDDGTQVQGFTYAYVKPEAHCRELCVRGGGGRRIGDWLDSGDAGDR